MAQKKKIAVVLFNLGGPDSLDAVKPFLFNLFNDKAIIGAPQPIRYLLAKLISTRRAPIAQDIYKEIGGRSPLVPNTEAQAKALEVKLKALGDLKTFIAMRYWHPFSNETVKAVKAFDPDEVVLLPLYPQFSTTTSASSLKDWKAAADKAGLKAKTTSVCCYPDEKAFLEAHAKRLMPQLKAAMKKGATRILFTAHGLPKKIVDAGDPYAWQVEKTVADVLGVIHKTVKPGSFEHVTCYQSRVGPLEWIGPSTEEEIARGGKDKKNLVVVPIAFVSEHSETLVELDIEYAVLAKEAGVEVYERVATLDAEPGFIKSLATVVKSALDREELSSFQGKRICPKDFRQCPCQIEGEKS